MKRILLLLLFPLGLVAQQPFGNQATWHYYYSGFGYTGYKKVSHTGDTIISGRSWQVFAVTGLTELKTGPGPNDVIQDTNAVWDDILLSTRNDSVFYFDYLDTVQVLFDFNADLGDDWQFAYKYANLGCYADPKATVITKSTDTINGQVLEYMEIENPMDTFIIQNQPFYMCASGHCMPTKIYKHIGATWFSNLFKPSPNICNGNSISLPYHQLRCFSNDNFSVNFTNNACDYWSLIGLDENEIIDFQIYPNPSSGFVNVSSEKEIIELELHDATGRIIVSSKNESSILLPQQKGIYFLNVKFKNGYNEVRKVMKI